MVRFALDSGRSGQLVKTDDEGHKPPTSNTCLGELEAFYDGAERQRRQMGQILNHYDEAE